MLSRQRGVDIPWWSPYRVDKTGIRRGLESASGYARGLLLDIGCGSRPYQPLLPHASRYIGIDLPAAAARGGKPDVYGDALILPVRTGRVDTVLCTQVLDDVPEPRQLLLEAARVLAPGGHLLLTAQQTWEIHDAPNDYFRFTEHGLRYILEQAGFEVLFVTPRFGFWAMIAQLMTVWFLRVQLRSKLRHVRGTGLLFGLIQDLGLFLDRWDQVGSHTLGYTCVARVPGHQGTS